MSFITEKCAKRLGLPCTNLFISVLGLGYADTHKLTKSSLCKIRPKDQEEDSFSVMATILLKICSDIPAARIDHTYKWEHIKNLADPHFSVAGLGDLSFGVDAFPNILTDGRFSGQPDKPSTINTMFIWILMGNVQSDTQHSFSLPFVSSESSLQSVLKKFWEIKEMLHKPTQSWWFVVRNYVHRNTHANWNWSFRCRLPFRDPPPTFDNSHSVALRRLLLLERSLIRSPALYESCYSFMKDYLECCHMEIL